MGAVGIAGGAMERRTDARAAREAGKDGRDAAAPPLPREHGAWVMLSLPLVLGIAAGEHRPVVPLVLLAVTALAVFLAQDLARRLVRGRAPEGTTRWLLRFGFVASLAGAGLVATVPGAARLGLFVLGGIAGALLAVLLWALARPGGKRFDRSVLGELAAVPALTLAGPAAAVITTGHLGVEAWAVMGLSVAWFGGGMLFVKMLLDGWKRSRRGLPVRTAPLALLTLGWHVVALAALVALGGPRWTWLAAAFAPGLARAVWGYTRLGRPLPRLMVLGIVEAVLAAVYVGVSAAAIA